MNRSKKQFCCRTNPESSAESANRLARSETSEPASRSLSHSTAADTSLQNPVIRLTNCPLRDEAKAVFQGGDFIIFVIRHFGIPYRYPARRNRLAAAKAGFAWVLRLKDLCCPWRVPAISPWSRPAGFRCRRFRRRCRSLPAQCPRPAGGRRKTLRR